MKTIKQIFIKFSIILNDVLINYIILIINKLKAKIYDKVASFRTSNIVMFGNSLTAGGKWNADLNRFDIKNSGTVGFTSSHFVWILDSAVIKYKPKICFIEGGINDIGVGIPLSRTYENYELIVDTLIINKIEPVLQSTLYINQPDDSVSNSKVDSLNYFLSNLAAKRKITFLDLNQFLSANKRLKMEYTIDGVHIKKNAYKIWTHEIAKILKNKGI